MEKKMRLRCLCKRRAYKKVGAETAAASLQKNTGLPHVAELCDKSKAAWHVKKLNRAERRALKFNK